jgi:CRP/FNR family transcriptional regulator, cyclic AMP receptor protein
VTTPDIERLRQVPIFSSLDQKGLQLVASIANEFEAPKGHVLMERGQAGHGLFVIEDGSVRVDIGEDEQVTVGPGGLVGELSVLADTPRTARVSVLADMRALAITRLDLEELLEREPTIAVSMLRQLALRLAETIRS